MKGGEKMEDEQVVPQEDASAGNLQLQQESEALAHAIARYRDLVAGGPGLISEMVQGSTIEEIDASASAARQAYEQISRRIATEHEAQVPPGNPSRSYEAAARNLRPEAKI